MLMKSYHLLEKFLSQAPTGEALDIGAGRGKNSLFLADKGFQVEAIDINKENLDIIKKISSERKLEIRINNSNLKDFKFVSSKYSIILAIQSLNFIKKSEFEIVIEKIKDSSAKNGLLFISVFLVTDPSFEKFQNKNKPIEENTFESKKPPYWWHFFKKDELKNYFGEDYQVLYYQERIVKDKKPIPHFHGIGEIVVKKIS